MISKRESICAVVVLNWNKWEMTLKCLQSVEKTRGINYFFILIDNGSIDDSVNFFHQYFSKHGIKTVSKSFELKFGNFITTGYIEKFENDLLIVCDENYGFAAGCDVGIHYALELGADSVFLLNNDAHIDSRTISLMTEISRQKDAAIIGPQIFNQHNVFSGSKWPMYWFIGDNISSSVKEKDCWPSDILSGSALYLRKDLLEERYRTDSFYLDPGYFLYWEDTDLCLFAKRKGYLSLISRDAYVMHEGSGSSGSLFNAINIYYTCRNSILFANRWVFCPANFLFIVLYFFKWLLILKPKRLNLIWYSCLGFWDGLKGKTGKWKHHPRQIE